MFINNNESWSTEKSNKCQYGNCRKPRTYGSVVHDGVTLACGLLGVGGES